MKRTALGIVVLLSTLCAAFSPAGPAAAQKRLPLPKKPPVDVDANRKTPVVPTELVRGALRRGRTAPLNNASSLEEFFTALPAWAPGGWTSMGSVKPRRNGDAPIGNPRTRTEQAGNRDYKVTRQNYSLTATPTEIVCFDPATTVFWPGSLIQERGMRQGLGSLRPLPNLQGKRAPLKVFVRDGAQVLVSNPDAADVSQAVGRLRSGMNNKPMATSTNFDYSASATTEQSALHLGLSAQYLTSSVKAVLNTKAKANEESINGTFTLKAYTIGIQPVASGWRGFFNDKFTLQDAKALVEADDLSMANQPCYVDSVTYGTIVVFNMTRKYSEEEIKAKVNAKASIGFASGGVDAAVDRIKNSTNTVVRFTTIGGPGLNATNAVRAVTQGQFNEALAQLVAKPPVSTELAPISYTVRALKDGTLAAMQRTTDYTYAQYAPNPVGENLMVKVSFRILDADDGIADNTVECWSEVRINDLPVGGITRGSAASRERGGSLDIPGIPIQVHYNENTGRKMAVRLLDRDKGSQDDLLGNWIVNFDPAAQVGQEAMVVPGNRIDKKVKSELRIVVERTGYL